MLLNNNGAKVLLSSVNSQPDYELNLFVFILYFNKTAICHDSKLAEPTCKQDSECLHPYTLFPHEVIGSNSPIIF